MSRTSNHCRLNLKTLRLFISSNLRTQNALHFFYLLVCRNIWQSPERYRWVLKPMFHKVNPILYYMVCFVCLMERSESLIDKEWLWWSAEESTSFIFHEVFYPFRLSLYLLCKCVLKWLLEYWGLIYFFSILIFSILTQFLDKLRFPFLVQHRCILFVRFIVLLTNQSQLFFLLLFLLLFLFDSFLLLFSFKHGSDIDCIFRLII